MSDYTDITVNALPGSRSGVVAYCARTGKLSVADDPRGFHRSLHTALAALAASQAKEAGG